MKINTLKTARCTGTIVMGITLNIKEITCEKAYVHACAHIQGK